MDSLQYTIYFHIKIMHFGVYSDSSLSLQLSYPLSNDNAFVELGAEGAGGGLLDNDSVFWLFCTEFTFAAPEVTDVEEGVIEEGLIGEGSIGEAVVEVTVFEVTVFEAPTFAVLRLPVVTTEVDDVAGVAVAGVFRLTKLAKDDFWFNPILLAAGFLNDPIEN